MVREQEVGREFDGGGVAAMHTGGGNEVNRMSARVYGATMATAAVELHVAHLLCQGTLVLGCPLRLLPLVGLVVGSQSDRERGERHQ